jgi:hypothetical protein
MSQVEIKKDDLAEAVEAAGLDPSAVYWDYSGRGMYGATCFGIVGSLSDAVKVLIGLAEQETRNEGDAENVRELVDLMRTDSMGPDSIVYFPGAEAV